MYRRHASTELLRPCQYHIFRILHYSQKNGWGKEKHKSCYLQQGVVHFFRFHSKVSKGKIMEQINLNNNFWEFFVNVLKVCDPIVDMHSMVDNDTSYGFYL